MADRHEDLKGKVVSVKALVTKGTHGDFRLVVRLMEAARIPESIPLTRHELSVQYIQDAACRYKEKELSAEEVNLLIHMVGCVYDDAERKPMLREAVILKNAVALHEQIALLEHFLHANRDKSGMIYDKHLGNYIYLPKEGV